MQTHQKGMNMPVSTRAVAVSAASVVAIGLVAIYAVTTRIGDDPFSQCRASAVSGGAGAIDGRFTLVDEDGRAVTEKDLKLPSLVYFGYTYCPDVCPTDTLRNAEAVDALEEMGYETTPVFISVDPDRDTPPVLKEWTDLIHPRMLGLTGTPEAVKAASDAYRAFFRVPADRAGDDYLVDHTTYTYLMLPGSGFAEFFAREVTPEDMAKRVACFIDASRG